MLSKKQIETNFNKSAVSYDMHALTQQMSAKFLVEFLKSSLPNWSPQMILDIGTGTGFTTEQLLKHFPDAQYLLNDLAPNMLNLALKKLRYRPNVTGLLGDAEFSCFPKTDLVISNLTFQWFNELESTIHRLWQETSVIAFSTLVNGTFQEWYDYLNLPLHTYPTTSDMLNICKDLQPQELKFHTITYPIAFENPIACAMYLKNLGGHAARIPANYPGLHSLLKGNIPINTSYQVFYAVLIKGHP